MVVLKRLKGLKRHGKTYTVEVVVDDKHISDMLSETLDQVSPSDPARHHVKHFGPIRVVLSER